MNLKYHEHLSFPGHGWIEPFQDTDCPLIERETALEIIDAFNSYKLKLEKTQDLLDKIQSLINEVQREEFV